MNSVRDDAIDEANPKYVAGLWCLRMAEGPLDAERKVELAQWLAADPANQGHLDIAVALWTETEDQANQPAMIYHRQKMLAKFRREQLRRRQWTWRAPWVPAGVAAGIAALLLAGVVLHDRPRTYKTEVGERRSFQLADGSGLSLDADTIVTVHYDGHHRDLVLKQGRANFTVAHDVSRPFAVTAGPSTVIATGTAFSVEKLGNDVRVILYQGHVRVLRSEGGRPAAQLIRTRLGADTAEHLLVPGRELVLPEAAPVGNVEDAVENTPRAWEAGQLEFTDEPLANAVERINRYASDGQVVVSPDAASIRISGAFNAGDTDAFVRGIEAVFPVQASRDGRVITLSRK